MTPQTVDSLHSTADKGCMPTISSQGVVKFIHSPLGSLSPLHRIRWGLGPDERLAQSLTPDDDAHWVWSVRQSARDSNIWRSHIRDMVYTCLVNFKQGPPATQRKDLLPSLHRVSGSPKDHQPRTWLIVGYDDNEDKLRELFSRLCEALRPYLPELQWGIMVHNRPATLVDHIERLSSTDRVYINNWALKLLLPFEYTEYQTYRLSWKALMMDADLQSMEEAKKLVAQVAESEKQKAREKQFGGPLGALLGSRWL